MGGAGCYEGVSVRVLQRRVVPFALRFEEERECVAADV